MADWTQKHNWNTRPVSPAFTVYTPSSSNSSYESPPPVLAQAIRTNVESPKSGARVSSRLDWTQNQPQRSMDMPFRFKVTTEQGAKEQNEAQILPQEEDVEICTPGAIQNAYETFGPFSSAKVKDGTIVELFNEEVIRDPASKNYLLLKLRVIAADRDSAYLRGYLDAQDLQPSCVEAKATNKGYEEKISSVSSEEDKKYYNSVDKNTVGATQSNARVAPECNLAHKEKHDDSSEPNPSYHHEAEIPSNPVTAHSHFNNKLVKVILRGGWKKHEMHVPSSIIDVMLHHPSHAGLKEIVRKSQALDLSFDVDVEVFEMLAASLLASDFYCCSFFANMHLEDYRTPRVYVLASRYYLTEVQYSILAVFRNANCLGQFLAQATVVYSGNTANGCFRDMFKEELSKWLSCSALGELYCEHAGGWMCTGNHKAMLINGDLDSLMTTDILAVLVSREIRRSESETSNYTEQADLPEVEAAGENARVSAAWTALSSNNEDVLVNSCSKDEKEGGKSIIVHGLPADISHDEIYNYFVLYGEIGHVGIFTPDGHEDCRHAHVQFASSDSEVANMTFYQYHPMRSGAPHCWVIPVGKYESEIRCETFQVWYNNTASCDSLPPSVPILEHEYSGGAWSGGNADDAALSHNGCLDGVPYVPMPPPPPPATDAAWSDCEGSNTHPGLTAIAIKDSCDPDCSVFFRAGDIIENVTGMALPPRTTTDSMLPVPLLGGTVGDSFGTFPQSYVTFDTTIKFVRGRQLPKHLSTNAIRVFENLWGWYLDGREPSGGFEVRFVAEATRLTGPAVVAAAEELIKNNLLYSGKDDLSWTMNEYNEGWSS